METSLQTQLDQLPPESREILMNLFAHWNEDKYHTWKAADLIHEFSHTLDQNDRFFIAFVQLMVPYFLQLASAYYAEQHTGDT